MECDAGIRVDVRSEGEGAASLVAERSLRMHAFSHSTLRTHAPVSPALSLPVIESEFPRQIHPYQPGLQEDTRSWMDHRHDRDVAHGRGAAWKRMRGEPYRAQNALRLADGLTDGTAQGAEPGAAAPVAGRAGSAVTPVCGGQTRNTP
jgi:hypothetical protein